MWAGSGELTMGSVGMGRALISTAVSGPNPAACSPHETVSLTIQEMYPLELTARLGARLSHDRNDIPRLVLITVNCETAGTGLLITFLVC